MSSVVRTRMAPSPTGEYHVGNIATLLKNYAFAKRHGGQFILRIEDTDQARLVPGAVERIMRTIKAYGLNWDEGPDIGGSYGPYVQSERLSIYRKYVDQLVKDGKAYHCFCSKERLEEVRAKQTAAHQPPKYDGHCRNLSATEVEQRLATAESSVIRLKVPADQALKFQDLLRGQIEVPSVAVDDQVLLKSDGFPTYHLAVVVDDHLMKITHVMRGEEWISSTPKHVLLYEAFGWPVPIYAHIPVFLNPDGKGKMSKRHGNVGAEQFLQDGFLPEALLNFFMILGWSPKDQREIMTLNEYVAEFDPKDISPKSVAFDLTKLRWLNGVYIRNLSVTELAERIKAFVPPDCPAELITKILPLIHERLVTLADFPQLSEYFYQPVQLQAAQLLKYGSAAEVANYLSQSRQALANLSVDQWDLAHIEAVLTQLQAENEWSRKALFMSLRLAVTGRAETPPLFETIAVLGRELTLERLALAHGLCVS